jgi:hypothetical protein
MCEYLGNDIKRMDPKDKVLTKALGDVERCVKGYSSRNGFGKIGGLFYRIWNAIKAVFGQSDWQKGQNALKTIADQGISLISMNLNYIEPLNNLFKEMTGLNSIEDFAQQLTGMGEPLGKIMAFVKPFITKKVSENANEILRDLVKINENVGNKKFAPIIRNELERRGISSLMQLAGNREVVSNLCGGYDKFVMLKGHLHDKTREIIQSSRA